MEKNMTMVASLDFQIGEGSKTGNGLIEDWQSKVDDFVEKLI